METRVEPQFRYSEFQQKDYTDFGETSPRSYSGDNDKRDKERTRDRERRRERRRRERERDRDREHHSRDRDTDRDRDRDRDRPDRDRDRSRRRESRFSDSGRNREPKSRSPDEFDGACEYDHGEGFYEEGGYIDHPTHSSSDDFGGKNGRGQDSDRDRDRERGGDRWMTETPTNTILLRGLPPVVDEKDIKAELMLFGAPIKDVRLMKRKDTESDQTKEGDGFDQVGNNPCNTLILRGLDALTTEENIITALSSVSTITVKNTKVVRDELTATSRGFAFVEFNTLADSSQMFYTLEHLPAHFEVDGKAIIVGYAKNTYSTIMATMNQPAAQWSQEEVQTQYTVGAYSYDSTTGQYYDPQTGQSYDYSAYYQQQDGSVTQTQTDSTNAAAAVAQAAIQQAQAAKSMQKQHQAAQKQIVGSIAPKTTDASADGTALNHQEWSSAQSAELDSTDYPKYPAPDVSAYQYDETSGYYYDPSTSLYYDANTQYYYNSTTGQFMYWDGEKETYLPAPSQDHAVPTFDRQGDDKREEEGKGKKDKDKKEKVKIAKKIAKDMEKWAKTLNAQKEAIKDGFNVNVKATLQPPFGKPKMEMRESATADAGFAILEMAKAERLTPGLFQRKEDKQLMPPPPMLGGGKQGPKPLLVASYGGDSDSDDDLDGAGHGDEEKLLDWNKMACLLCKRQFPSKEGLQRHQQLSDLHKKNLESLKSSKVADASGLYRDRAKERRQKYGKPSPPLPAKKQDRTAPIPFEQPTRPGMDTGNVGNKLMQKMGWNQGQGLGKVNQGMTAPVETTIRQAQAGLGARGSTYDVNPGDNYKVAAKKTMFSRYTEVD